MNIVTIDFRECKKVVELHHVLQQQLDFPAWYGCNADALWDLLTGYIELPLTVCFFFPDEPSEYVQKEIERIITVFRRCKTQDYEVSALDGYGKVLC